VDLGGGGDGTVKDPYKRRGFGDLEQCRTNTESRKHIVIRSDSRKGKTRGKDRASEKPRGEVKPEW